MVPRLPSYKPMQIPLGLYLCSIALIIRSQVPRMAVGTRICCSIRHSPHLLLDDSALLDSIRGRCVADSILDMACLPRW